MLTKNNGIVVLKVEFLRKANMILKIKTRTHTCALAYAVVFITALVVFAYLRSPEKPKWDGVMPDERAQGAVISSGVAPALLARLVPHVELSKHETKSDTAFAGANNVSVPPTLPPLSPYGMAAIGSGGAWDGHTENGQNTPFETRISTSLRDHLGNPCVLNHDKITTHALRGLVPPPDMKDNCGYQSTLILRKDALPADVLAHLPPSYMLASSEVYVYAHSGMWGVADFEALVRRGQVFGEMANVNMYLLLKQSNSPWAESFVSQGETYVGEKTLLKHFLSTGKCPTADAVVEQFCFEQK